MKKLVSILLFTMLCGVASAQTTNVTATVTDSDGVNWINAPFTATFVGSGPGQPSINGQIFTQSYSGFTNSSGVLTINGMGDVGFIVPPNSSWKFTITPAVTGGHTYTVNVPVHGASQDISAAINSVIVAPRLSGGPSIQAYADVEVAATPGNTYFRISDSAQRCYQASWVTCGAGGSAISVQTNGVNNASQTLLNMQPSTVNAVGLTVTPTNPSSGNETYEVTGGSYTGTASNLSGTPALPNGTTATTQSVSDNTTKLATDAFVLANAFTNPMTTTGDVVYGGTSGAATRLAGNTAATDQVLISHGTGSVASAPTFSNSPALSAANMTSVVNSFNTRTGAVSPTLGDYTAAQVTNAFDLSNSGQQTASGTTAGAAGSTTNATWGIAAANNGFYGSTNTISASIAGTQRWQTSATGLHLGTNLLAFGSAVTTDDLKLTRSASGILQVNQSSGTNNGTVQTGLFENSIGTAIASATTIAPTSQITHVTGTTAIQTITAPVGMSSTIGGCLNLVADGAWSTTSGGNISTIFIASAGTIYDFCYDGTNWYVQNVFAPTSLLATGIVDGLTPVTVTTGATATLGAGTYQSGYTFNQNATAATAITYTLPTAAAGKQYCVANSYNGSAADTGTLEVITSATGQFIIFTDGTLSATGGYVISAGAARDSACFVGVDSTHWVLYPSSGTWTKH
jgi:hypothetical protein